MTDSEGFQKPVDQSGADAGQWWGQQPPQQPYPQAGYPQAGYPQAGYPQAGYSEGGYPQAGYPQPGYGRPAYGQPPQYNPNIDPAAPYGRDPVTGEPLSDKQQLVAGLLQLFAGGFGAGRWYTGHTGIAIAQLLTCGGLGIWALIDGIMMLTGNVRDANGRKLRP